MNVPAKDEVFPRVILRGRFEDYPLGVAVEVRVPSFIKSNAEYTVQLIRTQEVCLILDVTYNILLLNNVSIPNVKKFFQNIPLFVSNNVMYPPLHTSGKGAILNPLKKTQLEKVVRQMRACARPIDLFAFFSRRHMFGTDALACHTHVRQYIEAMLHSMASDPILHPPAAIQKKKDGRHSYKKREVGYSYSIFPKVTFFGDRLLNAPIGTIHPISQNKHVLNVMHVATIEKNNGRCELYTLKAVMDDSLFTNLPFVVQNMRMFNAGNCVMEKSVHEEFVKAFAECKQQGRLPMDILAFFKTTVSFSLHKYLHIPSYKKFRSWIDEEYAKEEEEDISSIVEISSEEEKDSTQRIPPPALPTMLSLPVDPTMCSPPVDPTMLSPPVDITMVNPTSAQCILPDSVSNIPAVVETIPPPPESLQPIIPFLNPQKMPPCPPSIETFNTNVEEVEGGSHADNMRLHVYATKVIFGENITVGAFKRLVAMNDHAARFGMRHHEKVTSLQAVVDYMRVVQQEVLPYLVFVHMTPEQMEYLPKSYDRILNMQRVLERERSLLPIYQEKMHFDHDAFVEPYIAYLEGMFQKQAAYAEALQQYASLSKRVILYFAVWRISSEQPDQPMVLLTF